MKYEYLFRLVMDYDEVQKLNRLLENGWEPVREIPDSKSGILCLFRKLLKEKANDQSGYDRGT